MSNENSFAGAASNPVIYWSNKQKRCTLPFPFSRTDKAKGYPLNSSKCSKVALCIYGLRKPVRCAFVRLQQYIRHTLHTEWIHAENKNAEISCHLWARATNGGMFSLSGIWCFVCLKFDTHESWWTEFFLHLIVSQKILNMLFSNGSRNLSLIIQYELFFRLPRIFEYNIMEFFLKDRESFFS